MLVYFNSLMVILLMCLVFLMLFVSGEDLFMVYDYLFVDLSMKVDMITILFFVILFFVFSNIILFSVQYMSFDKDYFFNFFFVVFMFFVAMLFLVWGPFFPMLILGWDLLGLTSYLLIVYYFAKVSSYSGMVTILMNRVGDIFIIIGILLWLGLSSVFMNFMLSLFIVVALLSKSAQVPFSIWLPMAMMAPTPVSALVHSSTLVTAGVYLLIRYKWVLMLNLKLVMVTLLAVTLTSFISSLFNLFEFDMKKMVAYSTLSQMSFLFLSAFFLTPLFSFFHLLTHALFKSLLFMGVGLLMHCVYGGQHLKMFFTGLSTLAIKLMVMMCLLSMIGFPFMSGFYSKDLVFEVIGGGTLASVILMMLFFTVLMTALYSFRMVKDMLLSPVVDMEQNLLSQQTFLFYLMLLAGLLGVVAGGWMLSSFMLALVSWTESSVIMMLLFVALMVMLLAQLPQTKDLKLFAMQLFATGGVTAGWAMARSGFMYDSNVNLGWNEFAISMIYFKVNSVLVSKVSKMMMFMLVTVFIVLLWV